MPFELPQNLAPALVTFVIGFLLASMLSFLRSRRSARNRDPRDDRIRSLEAEVRVAKNAAQKGRDELESFKEELEEVKAGIESRDNVITEQQTKLEHAAQELKESVIKTRELRAELTERATENVHAEAKIREVETELSVAQASQDLLATGVLDYKFSPDDDDDGEKAGMSGAAS